MGSSRLPGKVLQILAGKPIIWHVVHRLRQSQELDDVVIATTTDPTDDPLVEYAKKEGISCTRGSQDNVLERYLLAAAEHDADYIVRVTGDAPLVDPDVIDSMLKAMKLDDADIYNGVSPTGNVIHEGFTPLSRRALEALSEFGGHDLAVREHVTVKIKQYVPNLKIATIEFDPQDVFEGARISVDTPADLKFMNAIYDHLGAKPGEANIKDVVSLLKSHPELLDINTHVYQKKADEVSHDIIIRCDGGAEIGLGHIMRCLSLAQVLRDQFAIGVLFAMQDCTQADTSSAIKLIKHHFFQVDILPSDMDESQAIDDLLNTRRATGLIFDIRTDLKPEYLLDLRNRGYVTVCLDEPSERRQACDLAFYPPVPQVKKMSWDRFSGKLFSGWEWILLSPSFSADQNTPKHDTVPPKHDTVPQILISMGGADPRHLVFDVLHSLSNTEEKFDAHVVLGAAFKDVEKVEQLISDLNLACTIHRDISHMAELMGTMDLAISTFGVTAYELVASGVPGILLCTTEENLKASNAFIDAHVAISIDVHTGIDKIQLTHQIQAMLDDTPELNKMKQAMLSLDLRNGAINIARTIKKALGDRTSA